MLHRLVTILILTIAAQCGWSQGIVDRSADNGLMVRQIPGSESAAISFFSSLPVTSDTIYATIFRPANCPRCDAFINRIYGQVKTQTDKPAVLIAVFPDSTASKSYIDRYGLKADNYMFDTGEQFKKFLSFSPGYLHVGYILKFNKRTGELIVGSNADNVTTAFFKELNIYNKRKEQLIYPADNNDYHDWSHAESRTLKEDKIYPFHTTDGYKISEILYTPMFHNNTLVLNDKLALAAVEFGLTDSAMEQRRVIEPDSLERRRFVEIPDEMYRKLVAADELKNIPLQPFAISDDRYAIAYSLPNLWLTDSTDLTYMNKPCYIEKSVSDTSYSRLVALDYDFEDKFFYPHFNMKALGEDKVVVGVERLTWPIISRREEYEDSAEMNPFHDAFYDSYPQPTLATYRVSDGRLDERFGKLPSFAKKARTGYSFSSSLFDNWGDEVVYGAGYEGKVTVAPAASPGCGECQTTYAVFDLDDSLFESPDTSRYYTYGCNALAKPLLGRVIADVKTDGSSVHSLVRYCSDAFERPELEKYEYVTIDRATGRRDTYSFPAAAKGERRIAYGLRRTSDGSVTPYYISGRNGQWRLTLLSAAE